MTVIGGKCAVLAPKAGAKVSPEGTVLKLEKSGLLQADVVDLPEGGFQYDALVPKGLAVVGRAEEARRGARNLFVGLTAVIGDIVQCRREENITVLQTQNAVVVDNVVIVGGDRDGLCPGLALVGRADHSAKTKTGVHVRDDVLSVEKADIAVVHTQQRHAHYVALLAWEVQQYARIAPRISFVG